MFLSRMKSMQTMFGALRAFDDWLGNYFAMIRAGQDITWQLRAAGPNETEQSHDRSALLWRAYEKHGVTLREIETRSERRLERERGMITTVEECVTVARTELKIAKAKVTREIRNYPTPIAGCDCQFNHLLSERIRISAALKALDTDYTGMAPKAL